MIQTDRLLDQIADLIFTDATGEDGDHYTLSPEEAREEAQRVLNSLLEQKDYPRQHESFGIRFILSEPGELKEEPVITSSVWQGRSWMQVGEFELPVEIWSSHMKSE